MTNHCMRGPQHLRTFADICCCVSYSKAEAVRADVTRSGYIK